MKEVAFEEHPWPDVPHLIVRPDEDTDKSCLESLLELTENLHDFFRNHPSIEEEEPWFGWAFERTDGLQSELSLMESAVKDPLLRSMIDTYVERVIKYYQSTDGEPAFCVHEEKEAGSDAIFYLVCADSEKYFDRYCEYLSSMDLEHTLAQSDNIFMLKKVLTERQLKQIRRLLGTLNGGEYMPAV